MTKDEAINFILMNFSMAEADEIACAILDFLEGELNNTNNQDLH
ncbi:MAG: hypothetical protein VW683_09625 [Betaproteobacteria bacterium]|jgi:hypothetical protein